MEIVHQLLVEVYNPAKHPTRAEIRSCLLPQKRALEDWSKELPGYLRLSGRALPEHSPPNHIVTLKCAIATLLPYKISNPCSSCLYYTTSILVHKPLFSTPDLSRGTMSDTEAMSICLSSASSICVILGLFCRSFGSGRCTMALAYSIYTAALVFLLQLESRVPIDDEGQKSLEYCLRTLQDISNIHAGEPSIINMI